MRNLKPLWIKESMSAKMAPRIMQMGYNAVVIDAPIEALSGLQTISFQKELNPDYLLVKGRFLEKQKLHLTLEDLMREEIESLLTTKNKVIYLIPDIPTAHLDPWLLPLERELPDRIVLVGGSISVVEHGKILPYPSSLEKKKSLFSVTPRFPEEDELLAASLFVAANIQDGEKGSLELFSRWCEMYRPMWLHSLPLFLRLQRHMEDMSLNQERGDSIKKLLNAESHYLSSCSIQEVEEIFSNSLKKI